MTADLTTYRQQLEGWAGRFFADAVEAMPDIIRERAPIGTSSPTSVREPGELRRSIRVGRNPIIGGTLLTATIVAPVIQAKTTDQGAPPHRIDGNPLLRFFWPNGPKGPKIYVFRFVNHPGNPAQNWWEPALREAFGPTLAAKAVSTPISG